MTLSKERLEQIARTPHVTTPSEKSAMARELLRLRAAFEKPVDPADCFCDVYLKPEEPADGR